MSYRNPLPRLDSTWVEVEPPHRRIRILRYLPVGAERPAGVEARVLTSVHPDRRVLMALRDLRDNYRQE